MGAFSIHTASPATPHSTRSRALPTTSAKRHLSPSVFSFKSSFYAPYFLEKSLYLRSSITQCRLYSGSPIISASHSQHRSFDVVIIGAGIIGSAIARQILLHSNLSVALVDAAVPCSGATGAGQGYIWMAHKTPGSDIWELAMRSHKLWEMLAESIRQDGMSPSQVLGWKKTGSLLIGRNFEDSDMLKMRVKQLSAAGVRSEYLSGSDLLIKEPALMDNMEGGAAYFPDDCQLDAQRTVAFIEKGNRDFASKGRYSEFYHEPVTGLQRSASTGMVEAVQTSKNILYSTRAIVVAAGCWSGSLMHELIQNLDIVLDVPVVPRKGHLLVIENFEALKLNHGLMEVGYIDHKVVSSDSRSNTGEQTLSISMTATFDTMGNLLLGSSRQFTGFNTEVNESIVDRIWNRAGEFFPVLRKLSLRDFINSRKVRIGLRPYMPDGKPVIGPIPGLSNVILATGHEGGGIAMALGTAEMVGDMLLGNPGIVDPLPFSVQGRCC